MSGPAKYIAPPALSGALLYALTASPDSVREPLLGLLKQYASDKVIAHSIFGLKALFGLGLVKEVHNFLQTWTQNNFSIFQQAKWDWPNEIVLVTGGTGGFGTLMCQDFAKKGLTVIAVDVIDSLPDTLKQYKNIHYYKTDLTDRAAVASLAETIRKNHGDPSILINNAGVAPDGSVLKLSERAIKLIFGVNIQAHFYTVQEFLPAMIKAKKGHIVTIASMASFVSQPGLVAYSATKAAALAFHEGLQQELRTFYGAPEINMTVVHPTFAATPMVAAFNDELKAMGAEIITPKQVTDTIVKQVLSGKGKQLVIGGRLTPVAGIRGWPQWLQQFALGSANRRDRRVLSKAGADWRDRYF